MKGSYQVIHYFVAAYKPVRKTIINISTPAIAFNSPGFSSYATSKLAITRLGEFLQLEHPDLRVFTVSPGNVPSQLTKPEFLPYAKDSGGLMGGFSLYLNYDRADYLKGGYLSVNCRSHIENSLMLANRSRGCRGDGTTSEGDRREELAKDSILERETRPWWAPLGARCLTLYPSSG